MYEGEDRPTEVETRGSRLPLSQQEKCLVELHDVIGQLTQRLKPVLTPYPEEGNEKASGDEARPSQSPLADQMDANNAGIRKATRKIRGLMERIEC